MATIAFRPELGSWQNTTCSWLAENTLTGCAPGVGGVVLPLWGGTRRPAWCARVPAIYRGPCDDRSRAPALRGVPARLRTAGRLRRDRAPPVAAVCREAAGPGRAHRPHRGAGRRARLRAAGAAAAARREGRARARVRAGGGGCDAGLPVAHRGALLERRDRASGRYARRAGAGHAA